MGQFRLNFPAFFVSAAVAVALLSGCDRSAEPTQHATTLPAAAINVEWSKHLDTFIEEYFAANPSFAVGAGRHEFDGQLRDLSAAGIRQEIERLEQARERASAFDDASMSQAELFQREYLLSVVDNDLFWLRDARAPFTNPSWYFGAGLDPGTYVSLPYAPADQRARAFIAYAEQIPAAAGHIRKNLETPLPRTFIDYGVASFGGLAKFYRNDVPQAFAEVADEKLKQNLQQVIGPAATALEELSAWLESQKSSADENYALGPERFSKMLHMTERVTTPLQKLEEIGRADLERNLAALTEACKLYAPGAANEACIARMAADKPVLGAVEAAREQLIQLQQFVIQNEVVSIPASEEALVKEAPAYRRQNFAYINIPGPYEKDMPSVYYISPPDPTWSKAEQEAYVPGRADLLFTSIHEVWPGHFLQFLHSNRSPRRFGQLFVGYAFAEGWAHYAEELMIEEGIAENAPERQVGQALNALLRDVRYLCAIGLHTQDMTVGECEKMFKERAYQDPGNARQQAARGTYDPAYLNYTLGKLMIRKLRDDWSASRGGETAWKQFHDDFLAYGGPPVPLVREQMMEEGKGELF